MFFKKKKLVERTQRERDEDESDFDDYRRNPLYGGGPSVELQNIVAVSILVGFVALIIVVAYFLCLGALPTSNFNSFDFRRW